MTEAASPFAPLVALWRLDADGEPFETPTSWLLPVTQAGAPAMLKVLKPGSDERDGIAALRCFAGDGAVRVLRTTDEAVLMERAIGSRSLKAMAIAGDDEAAASILASMAMRLHAAAGEADCTGIGPLSGRFRALFEARGHDPLLESAATVARDLLARPRGEVVLHADLHHDNVLDSPRGWLAIDPKGAIGEAAYDLANLFLNPAGIERIVLDPDRARRLAALFASITGLDPARILAFAFAHAGLSAAWCIEDGIDPRFAIQAAEMLEPLTATGSG